MRHAITVGLSAVLGFTAPGGAESFEHLIGALHEHSGYSDGYRGTRPADYFAAGKTLALDFVGSAEHSDNARLSITFSESCLDAEIARCAVADEEDPPSSFRKWEATKEQAEAASDEGFTAFRGFEWTNDRHGHVNVFFSKNDANAKIDGGHATMESFWTWFMTRPERGGGADGLATFNHPGREDDLKDLADDPAFTWDDFRHVPEADDRVVGIEVFNRGSDYGTDRGPEGGAGWYAYALDRGWHIGAVGAEDDHETSWGVSSKPKTVLLARERSAAALREAMLHRRMYAVRGDHNGIRIEMDADGEPMGSRIGGPEGATVTITAKVTEEGAPFGGILEIVTNGGTLAASAAGDSVTHVATVTDEEGWYFLRARSPSGAPVAYSSPVWIRAGAGAPPLGEWLAGDLHVHTTYSHDSWDPVDDDNTGPDEFYTLGHSVERQFLLASLRGLDYLAITDHNRLRATDDPGWGAFDVVPVHSYENSLSGHAQMHGAKTLYPKASPPADGSGPTERSREAVQALTDELRADGGVFQVNHPAGDSTDFPKDADWRYFTCDGGLGESCADDERYANDIAPDTVEVWNISPLWQPPFPSSNSTDDAIRYWEGWLDRGFRVAATGGSDNHWVSTTAVQGVGQPTTWVLASERSERGVLEGLRTGRTFISFQPPAHGGPRLFLEADRDDDGVFESIVGDGVPAAARFRVRVENAPAGSMVRFIDTSGVLQSVPVADPSTVVELTAEPGAWLRADLVIEDHPEARASVCDEPFGGSTTYCRNRLLILAMTSAIYVEGDE